MSFLFLYLPVVPPLEVVARLSTSPLEVVARLSTSPLEVLARLNTSPLEVVARLALHHIAHRNGAHLLLFHQFIELRYFVGHYFIE